MIKEEQSGQYELLKDITTPTHYWRAGTRMDREGWEEAFPGCFDSRGSEDWFFDHDKHISMMNMGGDNDLITRIVKETFETLGLKSITYCQAAIKATHAYKNLVDRHALQHLPEAIHKIMYLPMAQITNTKAGTYLMINSDYYREWTTDRKLATLLSIPNAVEALRQLKAHVRGSQEAEYLEMCISEDLPSLSGGL